MQLESDILAEVLLPPSGITRYEARMLSEIPNNITGEWDPHRADENTMTPNISRILQFYCMQIQLRRTLNDIHSNLYKVTGKELCSDQNPALKVIGSLDINLEAWRSSLKDWGWDDRNH